MGTFIWILAVILLILAVYYIRKAVQKMSAEQQIESENLITLTDENFTQTIKKGVTLVDFWAPWCTPCKMQNPAINQIADELKGKAKVCKINVDDHKISAKQMKIKNIPNIIIFKDGEAVKQLIGIKPKHTILRAVTTLLN